MQTRIRLSYNSTVTMKQITVTLIRQWKFQHWNCRINILHWFNCNTQKFPTNKEEEWGRTEGVRMCHENYHVKWLPWRSGVSSPCPLQTLCDQWWVRVRQLPSFTGTARCGWLQDPALTTAQIFTPIIRFGEKHFFPFLNFHSLQCITTLNPQLTLY